MNKATRRITTLLADDDADDRLLARQALLESGSVLDLRLVEDGEEVMDYLHHRGAYVLSSDAPRPGLILLDLNMPRKDGWEVLKEIKEDVVLRRIPVVIFTTSKAAEDIERSYALGASSYIVKPVTFEALVNVVNVLANYWFDVVDLPGTEAQV